MHRPNGVRVMLAGFVGTTVMTLMMYFVAPLLLGAPMDIAALLGDVTGIGWTGGMALHFLLGSVLFPLAYMAGFEWLPGEGWSRGLVFGLLLWLLAESLVMPLAGAGFFHSGTGGAMAAIVSLLGHAVYGLLLGGIAGRPVAATPARVGV